MLLFDVSQLTDIDTYLDNKLEKEATDSQSYLIMSKETFKLFRMVSTRYNKKYNFWRYDGCKLNVNTEFYIAIDKCIPFGEVKVQ